MKPVTKVLKKFWIAAIVLLSAGFAVVAFIGWLALIPALVVAALAFVWPMEADHEAGQRLPL